MTAREMRQLGSLPRDGGYMKAAETRHKPNEGYTTADNITSTFKSSDAGYFIPGHASGQAGVDAQYMTAEAARTAARHYPGDAGYFAPGAGGTSAGASGGYMSVQKPGDLPDYMTLEAIKALAPPDGGYMSLAALQELSRDGGYFTAAALRALLTKARDEGCVRCLLSSLWARTFARRYFVNPPVIFPV